MLVSGRPKLLALPFLLALGGCVTDGTGSVGGSCAIFERPPYVVHGARPYDQEWIDSTIEGGVGGCKWERPAPRPAALDAPRAAPKAAPAVKKNPKHGWIWRLPRKAAAPVVEVAPPVAAPEPEPAPPPPPAPRSLIDELLHPSGAK